MSKEEPKIAISGKSGCGNTTVSRLVAERLGLRCINFTFRTLAQEMGLTLEEVLEKAKDDEWWDREVDRRQVELARQDGGCVLGSRLAIWMLPEADLKVYLKASPEVRLDRIYKREGGDRAQLASFTAERDRQDRERYLRLYNIDNNNYQFADIIIDTDHMEVEAIVELIIHTLRKKE
ncbi:MAG: (d)CMP kinase [Spirochaetota bacterium]